MPFPDLGPAGFFLVKGAGGSVGVAKGDESPEVLDRGADGGEERAEDNDS